MIVSSYKANRSNLDVEMYAKTTWAGGWNHIEGILKENILENVRNGCVYLFTKAIAWEFIFFNKMRRYKIIHQWKKMKEAEMEMTMSSSTGLGILYEKKWTFTFAF